MLKGFFPYTPLYKPRKRNVKTNALPSGYPDAWADLRLANALPFSGHDNPVAIGIILFPPRLAIASRLHNQVEGLLRLVRRHYHEKPSSTDEMFRVLMGDKVEPRREFIEKHALEVRNLDV